MHNIVRPLSLSYNENCNYTICEVIGSAKHCSLNKCKIKNIENLLFYLKVIQTYK